MWENHRPGNPDGERSSKTDFHDFLGLRMTCLDPCPQLYGNNLNNTNYKKDRAFESFLSFLTDGLFCLSFITSGLIGILQIRLCLFAFSYF